jgi:hypothetical protein
MKANGITLRLRALHGGAFTELSLSGPIATLPPTKTVRRLLSMLAYWSGYPVHVVLSVDGAAGWLELWTDVLVKVPERDVRVEFRIDRGGGDRDVR